MKSPSSQNIAALLLGMLVGTMVLLWHIKSQERDLKECVYGSDWQVVERYTIRGEQELHWEFELQCVAHRGITVRVPNARPTWAQINEYLYFTPTFKSKQE